MANVTLFNRSGPRVVPERITEARQALCMTMADLGRAVGVTRQAISYYETGAKQPEAVILAQLGKELRQPIAYFTSERPVGHGQPGAVFFRSFASKTKALNKKCEIFRDWLDQIANYIGGMIKFPRPSVPLVTPRCDDGRYTHEELDEIATRCRRDWGLGDGPIANMILLMESKGIIVARADFEAEALDAFSCWIGAQPFVFLSSDRTAVRSRFDAAHELGHLILHPGLTPEQMEDPETHDRVEREANYFAAAFLMPRQSFRHEVHSIRLNAFIELKKRWKVSIGAMIARCRDIGLLGEYEFRKLRKLMSTYGYTKHEPLDSEIPPEEPSVLRRAIDLLLANGVKDGPAILSDLRLSPNVISAITGIDIARFVPIQVTPVELTIR